MADTPAAAGEGDKAEAPGGATEKEEKAEKPEEKQPEVYQEVEEDAPTDTRPAIKTPVAISVEDHTVNCVPSAYGNILMSLTDGGCQFLLAGARANTGVTAGRYIFEVKYLEAISPVEDPSGRNKTPLPRNQLRVGVATATSSLLIGDQEGSFCFTNDGCGMHCKTKTPLSFKLESGDIATVLLNLQEGHANCNTISLFVNGKRACPPQPLPEALQNQALFPAVTYKNVGLHYNFGPNLLCGLPFTCRTWQEARTKDVQSAKRGKSERKEVLFPVALPDEGGFDWLDMFLEEHPNFTELSDRAVLAWAEKSGLKRTAKAPSAAASAAAELVGQRNSNDRPDMGFGISLMDDGSTRRVLHNVAPLQPRDYVVMEVKSNLVQKERKGMLSSWPTSFKRTAAVMVGEPPPPLKKRCQELTLKAKQEASDSAFQTKKEEGKKKRLEDLKKRVLEREKRRAAKAAKKKQELLMRKLEEDKKKKEKAEAGEEKKDEAAPEEKKEEDSDSEKEKEDAAMEEEEEEGEPPKVELTEEERQLWFKKTGVPDLTPYTLGTHFTKFSLPDKKEEDFDDVRYEWYPEKKSKDHLTSWVRDRKLSTRVEDLQPSDWFNTRWKDWQKVLQTWHARQNQYKALTAKKAAAAKLAAKEAEKKEEAQKSKEEGEKGGKKEDQEKEEKDNEKENVAAPKEGEEKEEQKEIPAVDFERLDVFGVEDIFDIGGGQPLFSAFDYEDWTMMGLRFELYLLIHAFRNDVNDPDRLGIHLEHLPFYFSKYFKKALNLKFYGVETMKELLEHVQDTVVIRGRSQVVEAQLPEELETWGIFVMLTEESRRDRLRRLDLGDESARLKLQAQQQPVAAPAAATAALGALAALGTKKPAGVGVAGHAWPTQTAWKPAVTTIVGQNWLPQGVQQNRLPQSGGVQQNWLPQGGGVQQNWQQWKGPNQNQNQTQPWRSW